MVKPENWPETVQVRRSAAAAPPALLTQTDFPCTISPKQTVELAAPVAGVIETVVVRPGQFVQMGDIIATFEDDVLRQDLALAAQRANSEKGLEIAQSRLAGLEKRLARLQSAKSSRAVPEADLENAQLEVDVARGEVGREIEVLELAKLELERAQVLIEKTVVRAPVSGRIGEELIDPGESPSQAPIATIYVTEPMLIEAYVPTNLVTKMLEKNTFSAQISGQSYAVEFDHRGSVADLSSNTLSVFFNIVSDKVLPGLDCKLSFSE